MESFHLVSVICVTLIPLNGFVCDSQDVFFNVKDPEANEVMSARQENVTLVCYVSNTLNANITITNVAGASVVVQVASSCLEYTIPRLTDADNGDYMCHVSYVNGTTGMRETRIKSLFMNVENSSLQCFRNGTSDQPFSVGDTLQLSCYCKNTIMCDWIETVVGTGTGTPLKVDRTEEFGNNKRIIRVIVGPLSTNDINVTYVCYYGQLPEERCKIGPLDDSADDFVLNPVDLSIVFRECPKQLTSTLPPISTSPERMQNGKATPATELGKEEEPEEDIILYIIISGSALLVLLVPVILCVAFALKRNRKVESSEPHEQVGDIDPVADVGRKNAAYAATDYALLNKRKTAAMDNDGVSTAVMQPNESQNDRMERDSAPPEYATVNKVRKPAVSQNNVQSAAMVLDEDDDDDQFCRGDITEYSVPVAFRSDQYSKDTMRGSQGFLESNEI